MRLSEIDEGARLAATTLDEEFSRAASMAMKTAAMAKQVRPPLVQRPRQREARLAVNTRGDSQTARPKLTDQITRGGVRQRWGRRTRAPLRQSCHATTVFPSRLIPLAVDLKPSDVQQPLGQFQAQPATKDGLRAVVTSLNSALGEHRLADELLRKAFEVWWPNLDRELTAT